MDVSQTESGGIKVHENRKSLEEIRQVMLGKGVEITNPSSTQITLRFADGDELTFMAKGRGDTHLILVADVSKNEN